MSTYATLREQVLDFMQQSIGVTDPFPGTTIDGATKAEIVDRLCLRAANSSRKEAELANDWVYNQVSAQVAVPAGETVRLLSLTDLDTGEPFKGFKNVKDVEVDGSPILMGSTLHALRRRFKHPRYKSRFHGEIFQGDKFRFRPALSSKTDVVFYGTRWMDEYDLTPYETDIITVSGLDLVPDCSGEYFRGDTDILEHKAYLMGELLAIPGGPDQSIDPYRYIPANATPCAYIYWSVASLWTLEYWPQGNLAPSRFWLSLDDVANPEDAVWMPNVSDGTQGTPILTQTGGLVTPDGTETTDWLLDHGFDYMLWGTICRLNHYLEVYLPRSEGKLPPPDKARENALEALLRWDTEMVDAQLNSKAR